MDLMSIAKAVGGGVISAMVPGGPAIVAAVNAFLPPDKSIPENATGNDIMEVASSLPVDDRAKFYDLQFDVQLETIKQAGESNRAMLAAESKSVHTTRPYIAKGAFQVVAACSLLVIAVWAVAVLLGDAVTLKEIGSGWPFVLAVLGPFVTLLYAYFGILKAEQRQRLDAINNNPVGGIASAVGAIIKAARK